MIAAHRSEFPLTLMCRVLHVSRAGFYAWPRVGAAELDAFRGPYTRPGVSPLVRYQCAHGIGHGLTMHYGYDLPPALAGCDLFGDQADREACYSGALMENIASLRYGPGSPMTHALHAAGAGARAPVPDEEHRHARFRNIDPGDPYYPCSILADRYLANCYHLQPSLSLALNKLDYAATARMCDGAPEAMRQSCYHGLGNQIVAETGGDPVAAIRLCALGSTAYQPWCYDGAVKGLVSVTHAPAKGFAFCGQVPPGPNRTQCYAALGWEIQFLGRTAAEREALCAGAPAEDVAACRFGAQLTATLPSGLTRLDGEAGHPAGS